jgi:hypothetical protein
MERPHLTEESCPVDGAINSGTKDRRVFHLLESYWRLCGQINASLLGEGSSDDEVDGSDPEESPESDSDDDAADEDDVFAEDQGADDLENYLLAETMTAGDDEDEPPAQDTLDDLAERGPENEEMKAEIPPATPLSLLAEQHLLIKGSPPFALISLCAKLATKIKELNEISWGLPLSQVFSFWNRTERLQARATACRNKMNTASVETTGQEASPVKLIILTAPITMVVKIANNFW